jgi:arylsulfatase A-like enzyme
MPFNLSLRRMLCSAAAITLVGAAAVAMVPTATAEPAPAAKRAAQRPNILVILMDDLGERDVGYAGSTFYETPAIDQLAKDGMRFDNAYVAYPRCTPSRYALMTGRNPARAQIPGGTGGEVMAPSEYTVAEALHDAGYSTFFVGKWHLGKTPDAMPEKQGFDVNIGGGSAGATGSHFFPYGAEKGRTMGPGLEAGKPGEYLTDRLTHETIRLIEEHRKAKPGQPFFAYLSHYAVHTPLQAKAEYRAKFAKKLAAMGGAKPDAYLARDGETKKYQDNVTYAAMIASMDDSVGKLRAALDRMSIADNTIIVFTSDHGGLSNRGAGSNREVATSNLPLRAGKGHVYDGGTKVPMIVLWPGHTKAGSSSAAFVNNTDHYPSLLEMAGAALNPKAHVDGIPYLPLLSGGKGDPARATYWYSPRPRPNQTGDTAAGAVRVGDWKLVRNYDPSKKDELFNLAADPGENKDLAASDPKRATAMRQQIDGWLASIGAAKPRLGRGEENDKKAARKEKRRAAKGKDTAREQDED